MFDKKSDYALNKYENNAIVYISVTGIVYLTRKDFANEEEFLKWKSWSDGDYQVGEQAGRSFYDNTVSLDGKLGVTGAVASIEDELFAIKDEAEHRQIYASLLKHIKSRLTEKQYCRLWLYYVEDLSERDIAAIEHVGQQRISKSITIGKKIIRKYFKLFSENRG